MKEIKMYSKIKELQQKGFSIRRTAKHLSISRDTVKKYREMALDDYLLLATSIRKLSSLEEYKEIILDWLYSYPDMSAAQVYDWLLEHYELNISERSVSRYVKELREIYKIVKTSTPRDYEATDELPMGYQMQLDFGVKNMPLPNRKGHKKVYFVGMVLSHSRYKWGCFQDKPFTASDLINAMNGCFSFFQGTTKEIVVDQDSIITVSENYGDIIYTHEFEKYKELHKLSIRVCRKSDPESKGKVESMVKFVKRNFLPHRYYLEPDDLNEAFLAWLERTGNAKVHGTTKKVPAKVFEVECEHLRPILTPGIKSSSNSITRHVRKDNTILYNSNRYSVPLGTHHKNPIVDIRVLEDKLQIWQPFGDYIIAEHKINLESGKLIKSTDHIRNKEDSIDDLQDNLLGIIGHEWRAYLLEIRKRKSRYYRDQLLLLKQLTENYSPCLIEDAICYCIDLELFSIVDVRDACRHLVNEEILPTEPLLAPKIQLLINREILNVTTQKRKVSEYIEVDGGINE